MSFPCIENAGRISCLAREDVVWTLLTGHEQTKLSHALGTKAGKHCFALRDLSASGTIAVLLEELLFAAQALLLKALDDVDGGADVAIGIG
jgi:hypothetical protein